MQTIPEQYAAYTAQVDKVVANIQRLQKIVDSTPAEPPTELKEAQYKIANLERLIQGGRARTLPEREQLGDRGVAAKVGELMAMEPMRVQIKAATDAQAARDRALQALESAKLEYLNLTGSRYEGS